MCGIVGKINFGDEPVSRRLIDKMTDVISHRGPDGKGLWVEGNVGFGHRRLSIIDLSSEGHQPMTSFDQRYIITYNGEIYNFKELRSELVKRGYYFRSKTDTEVVLYALSEWGTNAVEMFNGMFAFALWDRRDRQLLLARDRYGIKPLYFCLNDKFLLFGSEQKAILEEKNFDRKINKRALLEYFTFQNIFTDQTLLDGISIIPPGHYATIKIGAGEKVLSKTRYWDFHFKEPNSPCDEHAYTEELKRLFKQAVNRQLVSDVEIGSYLSGGIDSGSITAVSSQQCPFIKTFTCGFDLTSASGIELLYDEREKAEKMSAIFKTEHYEMVLKAGDMERCLGDLTWHLEEPRVGQSYPNFYAAKLASKFVKVVLSGTGGDELFGGYPWRYYRTAGYKSFKEYVDGYYVYWQRLVDNDTLKLLFGPIYEDVKDVWTRDIFEGVFLNHSNSLQSPEDYINHSLYFEAKTYLHGLLTVEDKLSMAHSLESRVPFLDNDLVDFAMECPVKLKLNNLKEVLRVNENEIPLGSKTSVYFQKTNDGKKIFRNAMREFIPAEITNSKKQCFSSPDRSWFKEESMNFVNRLMLNNKSKSHEYLDKKIIEKLISEHSQGQKNRRLLIWSLINFETFLNKFI